MTALLLSRFAVSVVALALAQSSWKVQLKRETSKVLCVKSYYGKYWAVGERGGVYSSQDAKFWNKRGVFTEKTLYGVSFPESDTGYVVGEGGLAAVTTNGGDDWTLQKTGTGADLRSVSFGNRNIGCAVGANGTLLVTHDGGLNWAQRETGQAENLLAVHMKDSYEGLVVGERGIMLSTRDSGKTWTVERKPAGPWLYDVTWKGSVGWAAGQEGYVLRFMLGKWERIPVPTTETLYGVSIVSETEVVLVGGAGEIWTTNDSGMSWERKESGVKEDLRSVSMSGKIGWAAGGENNLLNTVDTGKSWAQYPLESIPSFLKVHFVDSDWGWAVGKWGLIWHTRDGGETWGQEDAGTRKDVNGLFAISRDVCFVAGESMVAKTDDRGATWRRVYLEPPPSPEEYAKPKAERKPRLVFNDVFMFDERRGWVVGTQGTILYTNSGGEFWEPLKTNLGKNLNAVWFMSPYRGFVAAEDGILYVTENGGKNWEEKVLASGGESLRAIYFLDGRHGWIVGDGGAILSTDDYGKTWKGTRLGGAVGLRDIWFADRKTGWIAGDKGLLMKTWNGGENWVSERPPVLTDFVGFCFLNRDLGWVVGDRGVILVYRGESGGG